MTGGILTKQEVKDVLRLRSSAIHGDAQYTALIIRITELQKKLYRLGTGEKMAEIGKFSIGIRLIPDDDTMKVILKLLDLWQDDNQDMMVALVPAQDRYQYEIIPSGRGKKHEID